MVEYEHGQGDAARGLDIGDTDVSFHSNDNNSQSFFRFFSTSQEDRLLLAGG